MSKSIVNNRYNIVIKVIGTVAVFESIPVYTADSDDSTSYDMTPQSPVSPSITLAENYCCYNSDPISSQGIHLTEAQILLT